MPNVKRLRVLIDFAVHVISKTCILNSLEFKIHVLEIMCTAKSISIRRRSRMSFLVEDTSTT